MVAGVGLARRQAALVQLGGVGVVVTAAGTRDLKGGRGKRGAEHESNESNRTMEVRRMIGGQLDLRSIW